MDQMWRRVAPARGSLPANLDSSVSRMRHFHMMLTFALMVRPAARACQVSSGEAAVREVAQANAMPITGDSCAVGEWPDGPYFLTGADVGFYTRSCAEMMDE